MSLISCTSNCKHQVDGYCTLKNTTSSVTNSLNNSSCLYFNLDKKIKPIKK